MQQFPYIAAIFVLGGIASAAIIAVDQRSCPQPMRIMRSVWVLTGLWASFFGLWAYYAFGRPHRCTLDERGMQNTEMGGTEDRMKPEAGTQPMSGSRSHGMEMPAARMHAMHGAETMPATGEMEGMAGMNMAGMAKMPGMAGMNMPPRPRWQSVVLSTLHCGAGCMLADVIGEWFLFFVPIAIGGSLLAGSWVLDYVLALVFGIGFQYAAIRSMEPATPRSQIVRRAAKADILSLTAWQAGMYGWMAVVIFALRDGTPLPRTSFTFWFMMQIAMAFGFLVALPVNVLLIRSGIKKGM